MAKKQPLQDDWAHVRPNREDVGQAQARSDELRRAHASRFHKVFVQNPDGAKILEAWTSEILFGAPLANDTTEFGAGVVEGRRQIVKEIINQINIITRES